MTYNKRRRPAGTKRLRWVASPPQRSPGCYHCTEVSNTVPVAGLEPYAPPRAYSPWPLRREDFLEGLLFESVLNPHCRTPHSQHRGDSEHLLQISAILLRDAHDDTEDSCYEEIISIDEMGFEISIYRPSPLGDSETQGPRKCEARDPSPGGSSYINTKDDHRNILHLSSSRKGKSNFI